MTPPDLPESPPGGDVAVARACLAVRAMVGDASGTYGDVRHDHATASVERFDDRDVWTFRVVMVRR